jgi:hypothetical protein
LLEIGKGVDLSTPFPSSFASALVVGHPCNGRRRSYETIRVLESVLADSREKRPNLANIGEIEANPALGKNRLALSTHPCATSVPFLFDTFGANWLRAVPKRRIPVQKGWQFAVVGCDANEVPHYLGFAETYDRAAQLRESTKLLGWRRVGVFDAQLRELTAKPNA